MNSNPNDLATRFLLGELSEAERREVEERFLSDNEFFEQMLASEDALLDEYLAGTLSEEEQLRAKALFESSREQRQHVERTKQLVSLVHESEQHDIAVPSPNVGPRISTLAWATLGLFVLLGSWAVYLAYRQRNLSSKEAAAEQTVRQINETLTAEFARRNQLQQELESERRKNEALLAQLQSEGGQLFTPVTLKPQHFERSDKSTLQTVKVDKPQLRIHLVLEADAKYERYDVSISSFGGREVQKLSLNANQVQRNMLTMIFPAGMFGADDFKIDLRGVAASGQSEHLADYAFRIAR